VSVAIPPPFAANPTSDASGVVRGALTRRQRDPLGIVLQLVLVGAMLFTLLILFTLVGQVLVQAIPMLDYRGTAFVTDTIGSEPTEVGVWPGLYGSFWIGMGVVVLAFPLGIAAAVYLEEYAKQGRLSRFITINIRNLAGVPAVIYGVLGLIIFVQWLEPITKGESVLAASFTLAVLVLPIVIITSSEAIRSVPQGLREAGYGVGSTKWEVTRDHVLPYAAPGILTGLVLSIARALGEAAPLILVGAITGLLPETSLTDRFTALPMLIYNWSGRPPRPGEVDWENAAAAAALLLLLMVFVFNIFAVILRNRFEKKRAGL
jgi:phosphate transport system permease protein